MALNPLILRSRSCKLYRMIRYGILMLIVTLPLRTIAQHKISSEEFHISFESSEQLTEYDTGQHYILGYDNEHYAVDIAMINFEYETEVFLKDIQAGAWELAKDMGFKDIKDGGSLPGIDKAYYVVTEEYDEELEMIVTVYVLAALYPEYNVAYEVTVYCYSNNVDEGEKILNSFTLLE